MPCGQGIYNMNLLTSALTISCLLVSVSASASTLATIPPPAPIIEARFGQSSKCLVLSAPSERFINGSFVRTDTDNEPRDMMGHIKYLSDKGTKLAVTSEEQFGWFMKALQMQKRSLNASLEKAINELGLLQCDKAVKDSKMFGHNKESDDELKTKITNKNREIQLIREEIAILDNFTFYCATGECHKIVFVPAGTISSIEDCLQVIDPETEPKAEHEIKNVPLSVGKDGKPIRVSKFARN